MPRLIVGLGNPGPRYARTRHNLGCLVVEELAARAGLRFTRARTRAEVAVGPLAGHSVVLARPLTFMNDSGQAVAALVAFYHAAPADLLVVSDDLDQPFGQLRLRPNGSAGGHNGLRSIIGHLHHEDFARLRIGIGRPPGRMPPDRFVLQPFAPHERDQAPTIVGTAADAVACWVRDGLATAMNRYNGWSPATPTPNA